MGVPPQRDVQSMLSPTGLQLLLCNRSHLKRQLTMKLFKTLWFPGSLLAFAFRLGNSQ